MIVDSSVIVSILRREAASDRFINALTSADRVRMSAGTWVELGAVTSSEPDLRPALMGIMAAIPIVIEPVSVEQSQIGHDAYRIFGKGHHPARLNLGDCFSYALAKESGEPLLFKGDDFNQTDLILAPESAYSRRGNADRP